MNFAQIQLICVILAKSYSSSFPFWRYSAGSGGIPCQKPQVFLWDTCFCMPIGLDMLPAFPEPALAGDGVGLYHHDDQHIGL